MWWVEFDTNQTLPYSGKARLDGGCILHYAAQASFMSAAMPARGDFYYFVPTFLRQEFESCVQKKGTTAMQVVAVESEIF